MEAEILDLLKKLGKKVEFIERKMIENEPTEYLTAKEACLFAKISRTTFNELKNEGLLKVHKMRGKLLIKKEDLNKMIEETLLPKRA